MANTRTQNRIPCDALGFLSMGENRLALQTVNVSKNGACLRIHADAWPSIEDLESISGRLVLGGEDFDFSGRICWSYREDDNLQPGDRIYVRFGVEFTEFNQTLMASVLESLSIVEDTSSDDSFNI